MQRINKTRRGAGEWVLAALIVLATAYITQAVVGVLAGGMADAIVR